MQDDPSNRKSRGTRRREEKKGRKNVFDMSAEGWPPNTEEFFNNTNASTKKEKAGENGCARRKHYCGGRLFSTYCVACSAVVIFSTSSSGISISAMGGQGTRRGKEMELGAGRQVSLGVRRFARGRWRENAEAHNAPNSSSTAITISTASRESRPRSLTKCASGLIW